MRRLALIATMLAAGTGMMLAGPASGGDGAPYEVRAIFDNASFLVEGEEVRVAGAKVGEVTEVDVTRPGETVSLEDGGADDPGKAAVVMRIDDPGFQDFREDASCIIQPQSLLGEKFVGCTVTQPRSPGTEPPPPLQEVPDGQQGAGQLLLPLENNGKAVDLDLINNIMREPYADRFRIIINDLGAGFAARGEELEEIVERANPALRQTDRVLAILAQQNRALAELARDSDTVLAPLARERRQITGFIRGANETAQATAERRGDLEAGLARFPGYLRQLRPTMIELRRLADQATPVVSDFGAAAPSLTRAQRSLGPLANAGTKALRTLGNAAVASEDNLVASDPVITDLRDLGKASAPGAKSLQKLLRSLDETGGFQALMDFIFNASAGVNGFDEFGHYLRTFALVTNCTTIQNFPVGGCGANFVEQETPSTASAAELLRTLGAERNPAARSGGVSPEGRAIQPDRLQPAPVVPRPQAGPQGPSEQGQGPEDLVPGGRGTGGRESLRGGKALFGFLMERR